LFAGFGVVARISIVCGVIVRGVSVCGVIVRGGFFSDAIISWIVGIFSVGARLLDTSQSAQVSDEGSVGDVEFLRWGIGLVVVEAAADFGRSIVFFDSDHYLCRFTFLTYDNRWWINGLRVDHIDAGPGDRDRARA